MDGERGRGSARRCLKRSGRGWDAGMLESAGKVKGCAGVIAGATAFDGKIRLSTCFCDPRSGFGFLEAKRQLLLCTVLLFEFNLISRFLALLQIYVMLLEIESDRRCLLLSFINRLECATLDSVRAVLYDKARLAWYRLADTVKQQLSYHGKHY